MSEAGLALQDTMLSPQEQQEFSAHKTRVDNELSLLSAALSAAAQGKLNNLIQGVNDEIQSYVEPLHKATDDLASPDLPEEVELSTKQLIQMYVERVRGMQSTLDTFRRIKVFADIPNRRNKAKKYLSSAPDQVAVKVVIAYLTSSDSNLDTEEFSKHSPFAQLHEVSKQLTDYVSTLQSEESEESTVGDLDE